MRSPGLIKPFNSNASILPRTIVAFGAGGGSLNSPVATASSSTQAIVGVALDVAADFAGEQIDVCLSGIVEVAYGATITAGQLLTSDSLGRAVPAAPAAGVNARTIGVAMVNGVLNDIGFVLICPGQVQG